MAATKKPASPAKKTPAPKKKAMSPAQARKARKAAAAEERRRAFEERMRSSGVRFDDWVRLVDQVACAASEQEAAALDQASKGWPIPFAFLELAGDDEAESARIVAAVKAMLEKLKEKRASLAARGERWSALASLGEALADS